MKAPSGPSWKGKETGGAPTLEEHLDHCGLGRYQGMIFCMASVLVVADGPARNDPPLFPPTPRPTERGQRRVIPATSADLQRFLETSHGVIECSIGQQAAPLGLTNQPRFPRLVQARGQNSVSPVGRWAPLKLAQASPMASGRGVFDGRISWRVTAWVSTLCER